MGGMYEPRSEGMHNKAVSGIRGGRISPAALIEIDKLVDSGLYSSRSDFVNHAVTSELSERKIERNMRDRILDMIRSDPEIRQELRKI